MTGDALIELDLILLPGVLDGLVRELFDELIRGSKSRSEFAFPLVRTKSASPARTSDRETGAASLTGSPRSHLAHSIVVVHGEDFVQGIFVGVDVDHPAEDDRMKAPAGRVARLLGGNRTAQAELGPVGAR